LDTRPPTAPTAWLDREPGIGRIGQELARLFRRARVRGLLVVLAALLAAVCTFAFLTRQPQRYVAQVTFRVVESSTEPLGRPTTTAELREYILDGIFVKPRLLELMRVHGLYRSKLRKDVNWAYEQMRSDIEVDVFRNTSLTTETETELGKETETKAETETDTESEEKKTHRSARLRIRYTALNAALALRVAKDLARLVRDFEIEQRRELAKATTRALRLQRARMVTRLSILERAQAQQTVEMLRAQGAPRVRLQVKVDQLHREISAMRRQASKFSKVLARAETRAAMERHGVAIQFREVDWRQFKPPMSPVTASLTTAGVVFLFALLVVGLLVGAFDPYVHHLEDVRRLGLLPIGQTGSPAGPEGGSPAGYDSIAYFLLKSGHRLIGLSAAGSDVSLLQEAERIGQALVVQTGAAAAIVDTRDDAAGEGPGAEGFHARWLQPHLALLTPPSAVDDGTALQAVRQIIRSTRMQFTHHLVNLGALDRRGEHLELLDELDRTILIGRPGCLKERALLQMKDQLTPAKTLGVVLLG
jgi:hypothetical protein